MMYKYLTSNLSTSVGSPLSEIHPLEGSPTTHTLNCFHSYIDCSPDVKITVDDVKVNTDLSLPSPCSSEWVVVTRGVEPGIYPSMYAILLVACAHLTASRSRNAAAGSIDKLEGVLYNIYSSLTLACTRFRQAIAQRNIVRFIVPQITGRQALAT